MLAKCSCHVRENCLVMPAVYSTEPFKMLPIRLLLLSLAISFAFLGKANAQEPPEPIDAETARTAASGSTLSVPDADLTVEQLAERAKNSIVVVTVTGRDGKSHG